MIVRFAKYCASIPAMFLDGALYCSMNLVPVFIALLNSDTTSKYITPFWIWLVGGITILLNTLLVSLKMFRSTAYAEHQADKKKAGNTEHITKP